MAAIARVLAAEPGQVWLWLDGGVRVLAWPPELAALPEPGTLLALPSPGDPQGIPSVVGQAMDPARFPHPDGDFHRMTEQGGLRTGAIRARSVLLRAIRQFFDRRGFVEVDTPAIATSPGLELHLDAVGVTLREGMGGAQTQRWLVTSPEYHCKRLLAAGLPKIYSLGKAFRSGERGSHHNPEFAMLEWYRTGEDYRAIVRDARALVRHCHKALRDLPGVAQRLAADPTSLDPAMPWQVWSVREAVRRCAGFDPGLGEDVALVRRAALAAGLEVTPADATADILVRALAERVEPALAHEHAVVIDRWPACMASLARRFARTPQLAERFEIYLRGVEVANGFSELVDAREQRARFEADLALRHRLRRPIYPIDERFLAALAEGCPPAAGVALGVDRLLMALGGYRDIDEVLAFPFERA